MTQEASHITNGCVHSYVKSKVDNTSSHHLYTVQAQADWTLQVLQPIEIACSTFKIAWFSALSKLI